MRPPMSSKFSTGSVRLIPPSWCKKGMFVGILPTVHDRPLSMNAYVAVLLIDTDLTIDLQTTLHLSWDESGSRWIGTVDDEDLQTTVIVSTTLDPEFFDLQARVALLGTPLTQGDWEHQQTVGNPRWDTGDLTQINAPDINEITLAILA